jgi:DNA-binding winged helix-turn-helix (wHTH) protein
MSSSPEARIYEFDGFRLDAAKRQLLSVDGTPLHLPSRAFDVLLYLLAGGIATSATVSGAASR